jgi:DNA-binding MarR family transcriptional regulator
MATRDVSARSCALSEHADKQEDWQVLLAIWSALGYRVAMNGDGHLVSELEETVNRLTVAVGQLVRRLRAEVSPGDLTLSQIAVLGRLDAVGWATTADLARAEAVKPQSMGATLASLEQENLVHRRPHPTDGRQVLFGLTDEGTEARRQRKLAKRVWLLAAVGQLEAGELHDLKAAIPLIQRLGEA